MTVRFIFLCGICSDSWFNLRFFAKQNRSYDGMDIRACDCSSLVGFNDLEYNCPFILLYSPFRQDLSRQKVRNKKVSSCLQFDKLIINFFFINKNESTHQNFMSAIHPFYTPIKQLHPYQPALNYQATADDHILHSSSFKDGGVLDNLPRRLLNMFPIIIYFE